MTEQEKLIHNERIKLFATFLNNLAVTAMAGGALLPGLTNQPFLPSVLVALALATAFHLFARWGLGSLKA